MARCNVCFRHCEIPEGHRGFCGARTCRDGAVAAENYSRITALALDPIEKKPLRRFHPGSMILSANSTLHLESVPGVGGDSTCDIELAEGLRSVGSCAFGYAGNMTEIELPDTVVSLGDYAFSNWWNLRMQ